MGYIVIFKRLAEIPNVAPLVRPMDRQPECKQQRKHMLVNNRVHT